MNFNLDTAADDIEALAAASVHCDPPISEETAEAAVEFLACLECELATAGLELDQPAVARCFDGSISLHWDRMDTDRPDRPWVEVCVGDVEVEVRNTSGGAVGSVTHWEDAGWQEALDAVVDYAVAVAEEL